MWSIADLADVLERGIAAAERRLAREQAVYGLDSLAELALHPVIAKAFADGGFGVHREQRYPADRIFPKFSEGERCDFVLTPGKLALREPDRAPTLFDPANACSLDDAFWLEIKVAFQHTIEGPNPRYAAQMLSVSRADVSKLSKDRHILHAGLFLIAFVEDEPIGRHDLGVWYERCLAKGLPVGFPATRIIPIVNRHGNGVCAIAACPVNHL